MGICLVQNLKQNRGGDFLGLEKESGRKRPENDTRVDSGSRSAWHRNLVFLHHEGTEKNQFSAIHHSDHGLEMTAVAQKVRLRRAFSYCPRLEVWHFMPIDKRLGCDNIQIHSAETQCGSMRCYRSTLI